MKNTLDHCLLGLIVCIGLGLMGFNAVWSWAQCPNYGTERIRCPTAPPDIFNGTCGIEYNGINYVPTGGTRSALNINGLKQVEGYAITANETAPCYFIQICILVTESYNATKYAQLKARGVNVIHITNTNELIYPDHLFQYFTHFPSYTASPCVC